MSLKLCLIAISLSICLPSGQGETFSKHPEDATYAVGEEATISCEISSLVSGTFHWARGDTISPTVISTETTVYSVDDTRYSVTKYNNIYTLTISGLNAVEDAGRYVCILYTTKREYSKTASLHIIAQWPRPTCATSPRDATLGESVTFTCTLPASIATNAPLTWYNSESRLFGGTEVVRPGEMYSVKWSVQEIDNYGHFSCYVGRTTGHGTECIQIPLRIPPKPEVRPESRTKLVGENAEFDCIPIIAHPDVTRYLWFVQGRDWYHEYTSSDGRFRVRQDGKNFKVRNLTLADNEMHVWCKAENKLGINGEADVKAIVYVKQSIESTTTPYQTSSHLPDTTKALSDILQPEGTSDNISIIIGGTIAGIFLLVIIILLTLYLIKDKDFGKYGRSIVPISMERQKTTDKRYSLHPPAETTPTSNFPDDSTVLYSLPLQKGGGTMRVKTLKSEQNNHIGLTEKIQTSDSNICYNKTRTATLPVGLRGPTATKSGIRSSPLRTKSLSTSAHSLDSSLTNESHYVLYSLSLKKGGGTMKVRSREASMEALNHTEQGLSEIKVVNEESSYANVSERDGGRNNEEPAYADVHFQPTEQSGKYSQMTEYANVMSNIGESTYDERSKISRQTNKGSERETGYANMQNGVIVNRGESPYVKMNGNTESESEYVPADFASGEDSFDFDSSFDDDLEDDPQQFNVEGLVYADVDIDSKDNSNYSKNIIGGKDVTVYADIQDMNK